MAEIQPFRGVLYGVPPAELNAVLAPPYDVIPPAYQDELYARDPRNVVRLVLNRNAGDAGYADAAATYRRWLEQAVLVRDAEPALYVLEQSFATEAGPRTRHGVLARFRAEPKETGAILPHEHTRAAAREDRFRLLQATRANFSPILIMIADPRARLAAALHATAEGTPALEYEDDGAVRHRLWRVSDAARVEAFRQLLLVPRAYIADGHHRYETALRYAAGLRAEPWTLGYFTPIDAPGLVVLPYHRILKDGPSLGEARRRLADAFDLRDAAGTHDAAQAAGRSQAPYAFGLAQPGAGACVAESKPRAAELLPPETLACLRALDAYFLHHALLRCLLSIGDDAVRYVHSLGEAEQAVAQDECRLALLMRPTPVQQIVDVAEAGESMPPKSTFFHPKLPSGLVIHALPA